jgi:hypothetical protein
MVTRLGMVLDFCFGFALLSSSWVVGGVTVSIDATNKVGAVPRTLFGTTGLLGFPTGVTQGVGTGLLRALGQQGRTQQTASREAGPSPVRADSELRGWERAKS